MSTITPPSGLTLLTQGSDSSSYTADYVASLQQTTAGATGNKVGTCSADVYFATFMLALAPLVEPPPTGDAILINFGPVDQTDEAVLMTADAVESDDCYLGAFRYRLTDQAMRVAVGGTIVANNVGLGFDADGALVVTTSGSAADSFYNGLGCIAGRLKVQFSGAADVHVHGWPILNDGTVIAKDP